MDRHRSADRGLETTALESGLPLRCEVCTLLHWLACHDFELSAAECLPCRGDRCMLNLSWLIGPSIGLLYVIGWIWRTPAAGSDTGVRFYDYHYPQISHRWTSLPCAPLKELEYREVVTEHT
ncbi:hypothetical protein TNCV_4576541 [Trichonephila clavipes]|nr:hypothetical protein TNCV_4576541 [Trichonephila clavipes]